MKKTQESRKGEKHPMDVKYETLGCKVKRVPPTDKLFKVADQYLNNTAHQWRKPKIKNLYQIDRVGEDDRIQVVNVSSLIANIISCFILSQTWYQVPQ